MIIRHALNNCMHFVQSRIPQPCLLCGARVAGALLCPGCEADLPRLAGARCPVCALPTPLGEVCGGCLRRPPAYDATHAAFRYAFPLDALVQRLKYGGGLALADWFAARLAEALREAPRPDLILPMPLHPKRLRERGYNQAAEIAKRLAARLDLPLGLTACRRVRDAAPQTGLPLKERRRNIRGAFHCDLDLTGRRVALLDDVMTSGASLDELARAARKAGAAEVSAWAVARTL